MGDFLVLLAAFFTAMVCVEIALRGAKVQSSLGKILFVYVSIGATALFCLVVVRGGSIVVFAIFWIGAFMCWFGARSHIESSILLRLLYFLLEGPSTGLELTVRYGSSHGPARRTDELLRSGLVEFGPEGIHATSKGRLIMSVVDRLR